MNNVLQLRHISKSYREGEGRLEVLREVNLTIAKGEMVALIGPSGSGKTTLLQVIGLLDQPDSGEIYVLDADMARASEAKRTLCRREKLGFVYQFHHLLPEFTALENVAMPLMIHGEKKDAAGEKAMALLKEVRLDSRASHLPSELSGGEQQRVAIARALITKPALLIADEPTGNLDPHTAQGVFDLLMQLSKLHGLSMLMATHNHELAGRLSRIAEIKDGRLAG